MVICCHGEKTTGSLSGGTLSCDCTRQQRAKVFRREADSELYLKLLKDYKQELGFLLYAYALMPTHVHVLLVRIRGYASLRAHAASAVPVYAKLQHPVQDLESPLPGEI